MYLTRYGLSQCLKPIESRDSTPTKNRLDVLNIPPLVFLCKLGVFIQLVLDQVSRQLSRIALDCNLHHI